LFTDQVIHIHSQAPAKPGFGETCNGCGVCCLAEPCPLGVLISRSRIGPCKALVWADGQQQYRCGALNSASPSTSLIAGGFVRLRNRVVGRWIAAGNGCDCDLDATLSSTIGRSEPNQQPPAT